MAAFNRVAELFIGSFKDGNDTSKGYVIKDLHFDFTVYKSTHYYKNYARFSIYNPNDDTISEIMNNGAAVVFKVGHENEQVGNIFVGQIARAYPEYTQSNDIVLHLFCNAQRGAEYQLEKVNISISYKIGSTYYDVLKGIADFCGLPLSGASSLKEVYLTDEDGDYIDSDDIVTVITNFVTRKLRPINGEVILSNNEMLYIDNVNKTEYESVELNFRTGLISAMPSRDEKYQSTEEAFKENMERYISGKGELKKTNTKEIKKKEITFESIMNPALNIHTPILIDATLKNKDVLFVKGKYWIKELTFSGSNYSDEFKVSGVAVEWFLMKIN